MLIRSLALLVVLSTGIAVTSQIVPKPAATDAKLAAPLKMPPALSADGPGTDPVEAFASYEMVTNGFTSQEEFLDNFNDFNDIETPEKGIGPTFNAAGCGICHPNGNGSTIRVLRIGTVRGGLFFAPAGGTLLRAQAIHPDIVQVTPGEFDLRAEILTPTLRGAGFLNYVRDGDIIAVNAAQPAGMRGTLVTVNVVVSMNPDGSIASTANRIGRFFRLCFIGTVLDAVADAFRNELGLTSPLQPLKAPDILGRSLLKYSKTGNVLNVPPTADAPMGKDIQTSTRFINALPAPPRGAITDDVLAGERLFAQAQCSVCHVPTWQTAAKGSAINGFPSIPDSLAGLTFHPYGDFATHFVGNEAGIAQGPAPRKEHRTAFLWGLGTRMLFWHDGRAKTVRDAILLHGGTPGSQAQPSVDAFNSLTPAQQLQLLAFCRSL